MGIPKVEALVTAEELFELPDDGQCHELVAGQVLSEPPAGYSHGDVASVMDHLLRSFVRGRGLGRIVTCDTGFVLARSPDTVRAPDVAFVSAEREREAGKVTGFFPGAPDIAVEVLSLSNRLGDVHAKVADYLAAGTRLVWIVDPERRAVTVFRTLLAPRSLGEKDELSGEDVLPGFGVSVAELFSDQV